jgi:hypothetical protein
VQRQEILTLESEAMLSALDICLARETLAANVAIAQTELAAAIKQAGLASGPTALLEQKYKLQGFAIDERLKLHNRPGNALNYGERVTFLRKVFTRNVARAVRHAEIAHKNLEYCYGLKVPGPSWYDGRANIVGYLLEWLDRTLIQLRQGAMSERVEDVILYLVNDNICPNLRTYLANLSAGEDKYFTFELKPQHLRQYSVYSDTQMPDPAKHAVRVLAMDAAFICREDSASWTSMFRKLLKNSGKAENGPRDNATSHGLIAERMRQLRESRTMGLEFLLPEEPGSAPQTDGLIEVGNTPVRLGAVPIWASGSAREQFRPLADNGITDVPPFGVWKMAVNQYVHGPNGRSKFGALLDDPPGFDIEYVAMPAVGTLPHGLHGDGPDIDGPVLAASTAGGERHAARDLGWISDIAIMLRVAVRPRMDRMTD